MSKFLNTVLEDLACMHITTMIPFVNCSCLVIFVLLLFSTYWYVALLYLLWYFYDRETPYFAGRRLSFVRNLFFWKYIASYFPISLHKTADLDPSKNYLFAFHPHGFYVFGACINFGTNATGFDQKFPGLTTHILTLDGQFRFPFYRDYLISLGLGSVCSKSIDYKLTQLGPGHSVLIVIGGAAEVLLTDPATCYAFKIKERRGFVRRALKTGASIVPVISFNEDRILKMTLPVKGTAAYYFQQAIKYFFRVEIPVDVHGRSWWSWYLRPLRIPIDTVVGAPLDFANEMTKWSFKNGQDPPEELVAECHKIYKDSLRKLYDDNKAWFGAENIPLNFM